MEAKRKDVEALCKEVDLNGDGNCVEFSEFIGLYRKLTTRQELEDIYVQCTSSDIMTKHEFEQFLKQHQVRCL